MEDHFGTDFSRVRVHSGARASLAATALGARAFTLGTNIVFGHGNFRPTSPGGRRLLAHELTHVIQQRAQPHGTWLQPDLAVEPTTPGTARRVLSDAEIREAVAYNERTISEPAEIRLLRDILGIDPDPGVVDGEFVQAVADYQVLYGLTPDGKIGPLTRRRLSQEILAEARFMEFRELGELEVGVELVLGILSLIRGRVQEYPRFRRSIRAATVLQRDVVLGDASLLARLRHHFADWDDFARCVELLGRRAPPFRTLVRHPVVRPALATAWTDSNPGPNPPQGAQREQGGWVYLNLVTNRISVRRQAPGATAAIDLSNPPVEADSIVVAKFHTHPNLGPAWEAGPSPQDQQVDAAHGVPDIVIGSNDVDPDTFELFPSGPDRRRHLAGDQGLPGAAGGLAPQARKDGTWDEQ
jgi:hypothetical protein